MSSLTFSAVPDLRAAHSAEEAARARDAGWYQQAKEIVGDLYQRSPAIYWTDFLLSIGVAWALAAVYFNAPSWSPAQIGSFVGASILFFRAGTFIHELVHMPPNQMICG